ncbi:mitotic spindle assembly checkpoint protein MAD2B-like, partial [Diadema antillarum]|uniref:mitotic spindle assembly checkpoint protein MAD2B-like n=1 Tax=Diadema antillarum TaxID=105358 RepID=UPI003A8932FC
SADILCEFLEIAVHQILYIRDLYPPGIFERRQKYNIPVQLSRHPELNQYITDAVLGIKPHVVKNEVQCVSVVLLSPSSQPVERFVFEITPPAEKKLEGVDDKLQRLEQSLRAFVLRLNTCDAMLQKLPPDCTFSVLVYTKGSATMESNEKHLLQEFPWVEADDELCQMKEARMIPLKSVSSDLLKMQLYIEQAPRKMELT